MKLDAEFLRWPETQRLIAAFAGVPDSLRFVGGAVRDAVLSIEVKDIDAATPLLPEEVIKLLEKAGIRALTIGIKHGTVTALIGEKPFEITTLRKDTSCDGRHAEVAFTTDWKEDASRRDFTMGALYLDPAGEVYDYANGLADAKAGRIRFIGNPGDRIREDYLRILRFFRFQAHYGKVAPQAEALAACESEKDGIAQLSGERIQQEMMKLLAAPRAAQPVEWMQQTGVWPLIFPVAADSAQISALEKLEAALQEPPAALTRLALLLSSKPAALTELTGRWRLSNQMVRQLDQVLSHLSQLSVTSPELAQKKLIRKLGPETFILLAMVCFARASSPDYSACRMMLMLARQWKIPAFPVSGDDLQARGFTPGKELGAALGTLENAWEESNFTLDREKLLTLLPRR